MTKEEAISRYNDLLEFFEIVQKKVMLLKRDFTKSFTKAVCDSSLALWYEYTMLSREKNQIVHKIIWFNSDEVDKAIKKHNERLTSINNLLTELSVSTTKDCHDAV